MNDIDKIINLDWTSHYLNYLRNRKSGLKKNAFSELNLFFSDFEKQDVSSKRFFIDIVYHLARRTDQYSLYLPMNLFEELIKPQIVMWLIDEPNNPKPYKLSADIEHLKRAVELDPNDKETLLFFIKRVMKIVEMNQHEIDAGYDYSGDPQNDLLLLEQAEKVLPFVESPIDKDKFEKEISELKVVARRFLGNGK